MGPLPYATRTDPCNKVIQDRYIRENLQALLDLSARVSRLSADKASEVSGHLDQDRR
jgi:hypothetical protein